jgi:hypothetical protein
MAVPGTETLRPAREGAGGGAGAGPSRQRAGLGVTLALVVALAVAAFAVLAAVVMSVTSPTRLQPPLGEQHQNAETFLYVVTFAVLLPGALLAVPRLADRVASGPNGEALPGLAAALVGTLALALLAAKASSGLPWGDGIVVVGVAAALWLGVTAACLAKAARPRPWRLLASLSGATPALDAGAAALVLAAVVCFAAIGSVSWGVIAVAAVAIPAVIALQTRRPPALSRRWGLAADLAVLGLLMLAVPDLVIFRPEQASGNFAISFETSIIQFHQDFILGPANVVVHGGAVLVDTASQYGVGPVYALAGWFQLVPESYGMFGLLDGILFALLFGAAYGVLRMSGVPRWLAALAMAAGVVILVLNLVYPVGALPQQGPLRFGLPMALIVAAVAGARWPRFARPARVAGWAVVGLSSAWAFEAFAYTAGTYLGLLAFGAWELAPGSRRPWLARQAAGALAACLAAQLGLVALTLALAGRLPDYGQYTAYLDAFLFGGLGDLTYDFSRWSGGFPVGAAYFAAAAAFVLVLVREPQLARRERVAFVALAGTTTYGIVLFSYFVDRSGDHIIPSVSLPALLAGTIWLAVLRRSVTAPRLRLGGTAAALALLAILTALAWSAVGPRLPRTALARALPGGEGFRASIERLAHPPALNPLAPEGEALLDRYMPGRERVPILVSPDLGTEILERSGRTDFFNLADPWEDSFVPEERRPAVLDGVRDLRPGALMLMDSGSRSLYGKLRNGASHAKLVRLAATGKVAPLQLIALLRISRRYDLRVVHRSPGGFAVVRLHPRR